MYYEHDPHLAEFLARRDANDAAPSDGFSSPPLIARGLRLSLVVTALTAVVVLAGIVIAG